MPNVNSIVLVPTFQSKEQEEKKKDTVLSVREALVSKKADSRELEHDPENDDYPDDENEDDFDNRMRSQILKKRRELGDIRHRETSKTGNLLFQFLLGWPLSKCRTLLFSHVLYYGRLNETRFRNFLQLLAFF